MIVAKRKSKYKHKVTVSGKGTHEREMRSWCEQTYGPGGRKQTWRFGWIQSDSTFYFKHGKDASMFLLRWT